MAVVSRNRNGFLVAPRRRAVKGAHISICIVNGIYIFDIKRFVGILQRKKNNIFNGNAGFSDGNGNSCSLENDNSACLGHPLGR